MAKQLRNSFAHVHNLYCMHSFAHASYAMYSPWKDSSKLEACRACVGRAQRKSTVHELCTAHSARRRKKKGGSHKPRRTYDNIYIIIIIYEKSQMYHPCGARFARPITPDPVILFIGKKSNEYVPLGLHCK